MIILILLIPNTTYADYLSTSTSRAMCCAERQREMVKFFISAVIAKNGKTFLTSTNSCIFLCVATSWALMKCTHNSLGGFYLLTFFSSIMCRTALFP